MRAGSLSSPSILSRSRHRPLICGDGIRPNPSAETIEIDIATAQNEADAFALKHLLLLQGGRKRGSAGAFGKIMRIGPVSPHRRGDLGIGDLHDSRCTLADDRDRVGIWNACRHT